MRASISTLLSNGAHSDYVTSGEALSILAVKPQTLYSYVSRGMIRRICPDGRTCLYNREDLRRVKARSTARSGHGAVAGAALQFGEPVLVTGITEITKEGPRYRQYLAADLARDGYSYEAVAEYLWSTGPINPAIHWDFDESIFRIAPKVAALAGAYPRIHLRQLLTEIVLLLGIEHGEYHGESSLNPACALVQALSTAFGFLGPHESFVPPERHESIAGYILRSSGVAADGPALRALNGALILCADHEFSPATFAARIAASSDVDLHFCVGAALHVHFGSALGLRCDRVEEALQAAAIANGEGSHPGPIGFSQPFYADGDPRAKQILDLALSLRQNASASREALKTLQSIDDHRGAVSLDAALVVLSRALGLNGLGAGGLLTIGRSAGWIAHVLEQYRQDFMIRPRGKFLPADTATG
jgi:citrate synthase